MNRLRDPNQQPASIASNSTHMEPNLSLIIKTLNALLMEGELDVQYNAAGAIFNVMAMGRK